MNVVSVNRQVFVLFVFSNCWYVWWCHRLARWFAHHLSNFKFTWKWEEWWADLLPTSSATLGKFDRYALLYLSPCIFSLSCLGCLCCKEGRTILVCTLCQRSSTVASGLALTKCLSTSSRRSMSPFFLPSLSHSSSMLQSLTVSQIMARNYITKGPVMNIVLLNCTCK